MICLDLIKSSLRLIGQLRPGSSPGNSELTDALLILNRTIESLGIEPLNIFTIKIETFTLTANQQNYTMGVGGNFNTTRPTRIDKARLLYTSGTTTIRRRIRLLNDDQRAEVTIDNIATIPWKLYNDGDFPLSKLFFWPKPDAAYQVELYTPQQVNQFVATTDTVVFPQGYTEWITYELALRLAPEWGKQVRPDVESRAMKLRMAIQSANAPAHVLRADDALLGGQAGFYNYLTGQVEP